MSTATLTALTTLPDFPTDGSVRTLGLGVIRWIHDNLVQPDGDDAGEPFRLTREQRQFVLWFYAIDSRGKFLCRRGILRRSKGWGKSPFVGAICLAELAGPVRFDHWDAAGKPVGKVHPFPWVVVAGVSETQTENTLAAIRAMVEGTELDAHEGGPLDIGLTRILLTSGKGKLVPITASSATAEGARPSFACLDETHHWKAGNGGKKLAKTVRRNLAKSRDGSARSIETTNAHEPEEESVAEDSYKAYCKVRDGRSQSKGILYDSREAPGGIDLADVEAVKAGLICAYGDATWLDLERILDEVYDPDTSPEEARRFYLNQIVAAANSWLDPHQYDANYDPDLAPLADKDTITLGFDGSLTDDSTALVGVRVSDGAPFLLGIWERPDGATSWEVNKSQVRGVVDRVFEQYDVVAFFCDVAYWETDVDTWRETYGEKLLVKATTRHSVAWDMRGHMADTTKATEALHRAFIDGELPHTDHQTLEGQDGAATLRRHVLNSRRRLNRFGIIFGKSSRESQEKVDANAALVLARMARARVLGEGVLAKRRKPAGRLVGF